MRKFFHYSVIIDKVLFQLGYLGFLFFVDSSQSQAWQQGGKKQQDAFRRRLVQTLSHIPFISFFFKRNIVCVYESIAKAAHSVLAQASGLSGLPKPRNEYALVLFQLKQA